VTSEEDEHLVLDLPAEVRLVAVAKCSVHLKEGLLLETEHFQGACWLLVFNASRRWKAVAA